MALSTTIYLYTLQKPWVKKESRTQRTKNIIAIINCMQYKKNKKIEVTRPFLFGKKIARW